MYEWLLTLGRCKGAAAAARVCVQLPGEVGEDARKRSKSNGAERIREPRSHGFFFFSAHEGV